MNTYLLVFMILVVVGVYFLLRATKEIVNKKPGIIFWVAVSLIVLALVFAFLNLNVPTGLTTTFALFSVFYALGDLVEKNSSGLCYFFQIIGILSASFCVFLMANHYDFDGFNTSVIDTASFAVLLLIIYKGDKTHLL